MARSKNNFIVSLKLFLTTQFLEVEDLVMENDETLVMHYVDGGKKRINIAGDSLEAIIIDVVRQGLM